MFFRRADTLRRCIAIVCMAATYMLSVQSVIVSIDRIEHALEIEHHANPLAGTISFCTSQTESCGGSNETHPVSHSHAHAGDHTNNFLGGVSWPLETANVAGRIIHFSEGLAAKGIRLLTPDRPPKA